MVSFRYILYDADDVFINKLKWSQCNFVSFFTVSKYFTMFRLDEWGQKENYA